MTKTELKKYNEKKIHNLSIKLESKIIYLLSRDFVIKINNIEIDKQSKDELLFSFENILMDNQKCLKSYFKLILY